ncbi:MAG: GDSL-type esterase/lipase family protein [Oscillospiraceae bacterium]|jgi:lysophospholipase L1-like esterase|nr:GDSL-type esterase/lipase family protein [Oscillospiraceae bacterium]
MKTILCYGDSNTFGANPFGDADGVWRHPWEVRYPGRLQTLLGNEYRVVEEGLGGRTTVFNDPTSPNRIGLEFLPVCVESHCPDIVVLMLGTNDTKPDCCASVRMITDGMGQLVKAVLNPYA